MCETLVIAQKEANGLAAVCSDFLGRWRKYGSVYQSKLKNLIVWSFECLTINIILRN